MTFGILGSHAGLPFLAQNSQWPCEVAHYRPKPTSLGPETFGKVQWTANGSRERTDRAMRLSQIHLLQKCLVPPEAIGLGGIDQAMRGQSLIAFHDPDRQFEIDQ